MLLTSLGYSGEFFDAAARQQYLRARFYNPANGQFNRLDPFAGNIQDPQSLHKYAYVHGDPVNGVDPTGEFNVNVAMAAAAIAFTVGMGVTTIGTGTGVLRGVSAQESQQYWKKYTKISLLGSLGAFAMFGAAGSLAVPLALGLGVFGMYSLYDRRANGGYNAYNGLNHMWIQACIDKEAILIDNEQHIKHAANDFGIPSKLLATVLTAEVMAYTFEDFFFDDQPFGDMDARSMGWVQLRTDNMRAKGIRGWNQNTPRSEIRDAIRNTESGIYVLAEYLAWLRDNPSDSASTTSILAHLADWDSLDDNGEMAVARAFAHAKDRSGPDQTVGLGVEGEDSLEVVANGAWRIVDRMQRFN